jgi:electron transport complex protein RnfB
MNTFNIDTINNLLPQTQCEACGFKGCKPYAEALAQGETTIDLCAPGGVKVLKKLGDYLHIDPAPYLATVEKNYRPPSVAMIDEDLCIGCLKCVNACPIDSIIGAAKLMHTVVSDLCSGCGLCVEPCPMDCIEIQPLPEYDAATQTRKTAQWRTQYEQRNIRLQKIVSAPKAPPQSLDEKKAAIAAALMRKKAKS